MRDTAAVKKIMERFEKLREKRRESVIEHLSEVIFERLDELIEKELPVLAITFRKDDDTKCIDITFELDEFENKAKTISNRGLLHMSTDISYFEGTLENWHEKMKELKVLESETWSGNYNEDSVCFVMLQ